VNRSHQVPDVVVSTEEHDAARLEMGRFPPATHLIPLRTSTGISMGAATDRYVAGLGISREDQDAFAAESHPRVAAAIKGGRLAEEIVPVTVPGRNGEVPVDDEGVRPGTTAARLARMRPAFSGNGTITAGSASQLSDGACAVVVMDAGRAERLGLPRSAVMTLSPGRISGCYTTRPTLDTLREPRSLIAEKVKAAKPTRAIVELSKGFALEEGKLTSLSVNGKDDASLAVILQ
jgi:hypothetical protein